MSIDCMTSGLRLHDVQRIARDAEDAGFDALWFTEGGRTAYLGCTAAALATERVTIGTAIAVAFPRSPMVTAECAWELADATGGRFVLGLGTQVKAHIERRYSTTYDNPGPRLREYVLATRAIFRAFQGEEPLRFEGDFFRFTLLGETWSPGPIEHPDVPIYVAAVRPWMLRMAGEVADGLHVHPFHSVRYLQEIVRPQVAAGAAAAGRSTSDVALVCPVLTIVGDTEEELETWRRHARFQLAFYGSTRTYSQVFEVHGWHGVAERLHELQRAGDVAGMAAQITDEMLEVYAIESSWDDLAERLVARYDGVGDRLVMYFAGRAWRDDPGVFERWASVAERFHALIA
jgi:probable F420-dependent oxidoreductase